MWLREPPRPPPRMDGLHEHRDPCKHPWIQQGYGARATVDLNNQHELQTSSSWDQDTPSSFSDGD